VVHNERLVISLIIYFITVCSAETVQRRLNYGVVINKWTLVWDLKTKSRGLFQRFIHSFFSKNVQKQ